jgi:subtilisin family serine protease
MIVVGAVDKFAKNVAYFSNRWTSIITAYAPGEEARCAAHGTVNDFKTVDGTSGAAAIVSGLVATFLGRADFLATVAGGVDTVPVAMKAWVKMVAEYHGGTALPVIGTHDYVPCPQGETTDPANDIPTDDPDDPDYEVDPDRNDPLPPGMSIAVRQGGSVQPVPNSVSLHSSSNVANKLSISLGALC